ncbi:MAG: hypothetical protein ACRCZO_13215, partial [Cetobacterium sp.]
LDLIKFTDTVAGVKFQLKMPGESASTNSREIMSIILDKNYSTKQKYTKLLSAPYGLSDKLVDTYIFVANKTGKITVLNDKEKHISLDGKTLEALSKNPDQYKIEMNEEFLIPLEVESVWDALNSLRIVKNSKARDFKADSNNDFDPARILTGEIRSIFETLEEREGRLKTKGIKTKELKKLVDRLKDISNTFKPEDFFTKVVDLPRVFSKEESFEDCMVKFREILNNVKQLTPKIISSYENCSALIPQLDEKIVDLLGYNDFKTKIKDLESGIQKYQSDLFNVTLMEELESKTLDLLSSYNNEYKVRHDIYHERFSIMKDEFLKELNNKLEIIKTLKGLNFKHIATIEDILQKVSDYYACDIVEKDNTVSICKVCDKRDLKKLENKVEELES